MCIYRQERAFIEKVHVCAYTCIEKVCAYIENVCAYKEISTHKAATEFHVYL